MPQRGACGAVQFSYQVFPAVTLRALFGFQTSDLGDFIKAPNTFWAIGPSLFFTLFDAGRRDAEVAHASGAR